MVNLFLNFDWITNTTIKLVLEGDGDTRVEHSLISRNLKYFSDKKVLFRHRNVPGETGKGGIYVFYKLNPAFEDILKLYLSPAKNSDQLKSDLTFAKKNQHKFEVPEGVLPDEFYKDRS